MPKKKKASQLFILITVVMTLFVGCMTVLANDKVDGLERYEHSEHKSVRFISFDGNKFGVYEDGQPALKSYSKKQDAETAFNLPDQLLLYRNLPENSWMFYTTGMCFEIELTKETEFLLSSEINIGALSFGIINSDTDEFAFRYREIGTEDVEITLEAGNYEFLLSGDLSNGTFEITKTN